MWSSDQMKVLMRRLEEFEGCGTTLVSLYIPGKMTQFNKACSLITKEYGTVSNIKTTSTRKLVSSALRSIQSRLKGIRSIPENGIAIFSGEDKYGNQITEVIIPMMPINRLLYVCDDHFDCSMLTVNSASEIYGFIVIDGKQVIYAIVGAEGTKVLGKNSVHLPGKHNKGGQSANRFERQRI